MSHYKPHGMKTVRRDTICVMAMVVKMAMEILPQVWPLIGQQKKQMVCSTRNLARQRAQYHTSH